MVLVYKIYILQNNRQKIYRCGFCVYVSTDGGDSSFVVSLISLRLAGLLLIIVYQVLFVSYFPRYTNSNNLIPDFIRLCFLCRLLFRIGNNLFLPTLLVLMNTSLLLLNPLQNLFDLIQAWTFSPACICLVRRCF